MKTIRAILVFVLAITITASLSSCVLFRKKALQSTDSSELNEPDDKTYTINTVEELLGVTEYLERHLLDKEVVITLENDITVNDTSDFSEWISSAEKREKLINWKPIKYFTGTFDGKGHTVSGLYCCVDGSEDEYLDASMFYSIYEGATVKNLKVTDSLFYSTKERTTAVIASTNRGTVENCHTNAQVYSNAMYVSLLVGSTRDGGKIIDCSSAGVGINVESGNQTYLAGISSSLKEGSEIRDCVNYAELRGAFGVHIGGITASVSGLVTGCANYGNIENEGNNVGGIVAQLHYSTEARIERCVNYGSVSNVNKNFGSVGGIVGVHESGSVYRCENRGTVKATDCAGGICGTVTSEATVSDCLNIGEVIGLENGDIWENMYGGIVGELSGGRIERCCNAGTVNSEEVAGGISGSASGNAFLEGCWNYGSSLGKSSAGGIIGAKDIFDAELEMCYNYGRQSADITFDFCDTRKGVAPINCFSLQSQGYEEPITSSSFDFGEVWSLPEGGVKYPTLAGMPTFSPAYIQK